MRVFVSYGREDTGVAGVVTEDLRELGHEVWYDRELTGGQNWWHSILQQIRECDLFIFILTPSSLESEACAREWNYAASVRRRILPVLCALNVKVNLLPPALAELQFVNACVQDKKAALALMKALSHLPEPAPLPDPLPAEPTIPMSYLGGVRARVDGQEPLSDKEQSFVFVEIKRALRDRSTKDDAIELLELFRRRKDLLAHIGDEIDEVLAHHKPMAPATARWPQPPPERPETVPSSRPLPASSQPTRIDVSDSKAIDAMVRTAVASHDTYLFAAGEDRIVVALDGVEIVVTASFRRWGESEAATMKRMGWKIEGEFLRNMARVVSSGTIGLYGIAALHKGTRDYLSKNVATRRFPLTATLEAALNIAQAFAALAPYASELIVTNLGNAAPLPE
jgi:hypothetical protein